MLGRAGSSAVCAATLVGGDRAAAWCGCSSPATCWCGPAPTPDAGTSRRGRTRSCSAGPACAAWSRWRRRSSSRRDTPHREVLLLIAFTVVAGHAVHPGAVAAVGRAPAEGAVARPGGGRAGPGRPAPAGRRRPGCARARRARGGGPARGQRPDPRARRPAQLRGLGAARHGRRPETPSELYARIRRSDDRRRARAGCWRSAAPARSPTRWSTRCSRCSTSRSRCSTTADQERDELRDVNAARRPGGEVCDDLERYPAGRDAPGPGLPGLPRRRARTGWHLRQCLDCGHVACCDSSPERHATAHFHETDHPVMQSAEPGEDWRWCYVHHLTA